MVETLVSAKTMEWANRTGIIDLELDHTMT